MTLAEARAFVEMHHRHHAAPRIARFGVGVARDGVLVGVAIVGNPISRVIAAEKYTLEVNRSATDGTPHVNSMLYGAAWRAARALGWERLITYTQEGESGASLRAANFRVVAERPARGGWNMPSRPRAPRTCRSCGEPVVNHGVARTLWEKVA
ncbi:XF1762 family protein [Microbacterium sp. SL75]|uniref:XF1762 family protein n=1 Tax=Microbacterium sp. SL75 TaxID=2995140 RepID=UPI002270EF22|nr:XF1762 family protein [Microbacterium sp. SL75]WAC68882.1 hypothetical protein OVA17_15040 [Microbacterium sp. SL75]